MGWRILLVQCYVDPDIVRNIRKFFRLVDPTPVIRSGVGLRERPRPTPMVRTDSPRCQTRVSVTPKITARIGLMKSGVNRTHTNQPAHSRLDANVGLVIGWTRDRMWTERCEERGPGGVPHVSAPYSVWMDQIACRLVAM